VSSDPIADAVTFVDTNVLVYAYDASETIKQPMAQAVLEGLWSSGRGVVSTQILQEFYSVATSRLKPPMSPGQAREIVSLYSTWTVVLIEPALILTASRLQEQHRLSFWDALVVEAARAAGAGRLLTEDLNDGQEFGHVRIEDPFRSRFTR
jgi:predicted nucleic acid-binding protein